MGEVKRQLPEDQIAQLLVRVEAAGLLVFERGDRVRGPGLVGALVDTPLHRGLLLRAEPRQRGREHQAVHVLGMLRGVRLRDHAAM